MNTFSVRKTNNKNTDNRTKRTRKLTISPRLPLSPLGPCEKKHTSNKLICLLEWQKKKLLLMMLYILLCHRDQWFLWGRRHLLCPEGQKGVGEKSWNLVPSIFLSHLPEITKYYLPLHPVAPLAPECPLAQSLLEAPVTKPDNYLHTHSSQTLQSFFFFWSNFLNVLFCSSWKIWHR